MSNQLLFIYLIIINVAGAAIFSFDKRAAIKGRRRIPERTLHLLELTGGVFSIWPLMYILRHKKLKFSYFAITYLVLSGWIALGYTIWIVQ